MGSKTKDLDQLSAQANEDLGRTRQEVLLFMDRG